MISVSPFLNPLNSLPSFKAKLRERVVYVLTPIWLPSPYILWHLPLPTESFMPSSFCTALKLFKYLVMYSLLRQFSLLHYLIAYLAAYFLSSFFDCSCAENEILILTFLEIWLQYFPLCLYTLSLSDNILLLAVKISIH